MEVEEQCDQQHHGKQSYIENAEDSVPVEIKRCGADSFRDRPEEGDFFRAQHAGAEDNLTIQRSGDGDKDQDQKEDQDGVSLPVKEKEYKIPARDGGMPGRVDERIHQVAEAVDNQK